jgi:hypothetical protein
MKTLLTTLLVLVAQALSLPLALNATEPNTTAPHHIIENPKSDWTLNVELNHADGVYKVGEELSLSVVAPRECYMHIMNINPRGELRVLWPLDEKFSSKVKPNEKVSFPSPEWKPSVSFKTTAPVGKEMIICFATTRPLNLHQEQDRKLLKEFLDGTEQKMGAKITAVRAFITTVQQEEAGWTAKAIEVTTREN